MPFRRSIFVLLALAFFSAYPIASAQAAEDLSLSTIYKGRSVVYHGVADRDRCPDFTDNGLNLIRSRAAAQALNECRRDGRRSCELLGVGLTMECRYCLFSGAFCAARAFVRGTN